MLLSVKQIDFLFPFLFIIYVHTISKEEEKIKESDGNFDCLQWLPLQIKLSISSIANNDQTWPWDFAIHTLT